MKFLVMTGNRIHSGACDFQKGEEIPKARPCLLSLEPKKGTLKNQIVCVQWSVLKSTSEDFFSAIVKF